MSLSETIFLALMLLFLLNIHPKPVHMKRSFFTTWLYILLLSVIVFGACSKNSSSLAEDNGSGVNSNKIFMKNSVFNPSNLTVIAGATITWVNDDNMVHTVTADNASFDSGDMPPGSVFNRTFNEPGTISYHCVHHRGMTGTVKIAMIK